MKEAKVLILCGEGLNCEEESLYSWKLASAKPEKVYVSELIEGKRTLDEFDILHFIGGFAHGDDHGAGVLLANQFKYKLREQVQKFIKDGKLAIGICNGFQTMVNLGILPGFDRNYDSREVALVSNNCGNFRDQWVYLKVNQNSPCIFTKDIENIEFCIRHAEGKFYAPENIIQKLLDNNQVALRYSVPGQGAVIWYDNSLNPNGSLEGIAGICDETGRIFGLMPHPEAFNDFTNHPDWTRIKEKYKREGKELPKEGLGIQIFRNAVEYVKEVL